MELHLKDSETSVGIQHYVARPVQKFYWPVATYIWNEFILAMTDQTEPASEVIEDNV